MLQSTEINKKKALIFLVVAAILWSSGGLLIKLIDWHPMAIAGSRSLIAGLFLLVVLKKPRITFSRAQIFAALAYASTVSLFVISNKLTTAANSILLQYTAPIYVIILGPWLLRERNSRQDYVAVFLTVVGMALFFIDDISAGNMLGNFCAIVSGVGFGLMTIFLRMQKNSSPTESIILGNFLVVLLALPFIFSDPPTTAALAPLLALGIFQLGLSYFLYTIAIKSVTALEGILVPTIEPILNPIWVFLAVGEKPGKWPIVGGLIVILAVAYKSLNDLRKDAKA